MYPETTRTLNAKEFADIKHTVSLRSAARRHSREDPGYAASLPQEISLQLTYRCNLRCVHCYQWNEQGFFRDFSSVKQRTELEIGVVEEVLRVTAPSRSKLFLWGGEPLMYTRFAEVAELLERYPRTVNMCTNGLLFPRRLDDLLRIGANLNLLVSLDGLGEEHDAIRGRGTFARTTENIRRMLELKRAGEFDGEVSLSCMVSHVTVGTMYEFMEWAEELGVNTVYFQFPWYISPEVARAMDELYEKSFAWLDNDTGTSKPTWHSYTYRLPPELLPDLRESMARLAARRWGCGCATNHSWNLTSWRISSSAPHGPRRAAASASRCPTGWRCMPTATSARASSSPSSWSATCTTPAWSNCGAGRRSARYARFFRPAA